MSIFVSEKHKEEEQVSLHERWREATVEQQWKVIVDKRLLANIILENVYSFVALVPSPSCLSIGILKISLLPEKNIKTTEEL